MDVFGIAVGAGGEFLRDAAIDAAFELGLFDGPRTITSRRMRALVDVLVALGALVREGERCAPAIVPARPVVPRAGWGLMADVIRSDKPLPVEGGELERRMHRHLAAAGAAAARELAPLLVSASLVDLGGGAGAYTAAYLERFGEASATLVDFPEVIELARAELARLGDRHSAPPFGGAARSGRAGPCDRVAFVAGDARTVPLAGFGAALLSNVLHLHGPRICAELCAAAARAVRPGGLVAVKDLRIDEGRTGPIEGLLFALNMAIYTGEGDVYETSQLCTWLADAGLVDIEQHRLATAPDAIVVIGKKPA